jgi:formate hydrogenlyase transcriptional activator
MPETQYQDTKFNDILIVDDELPNLQLLSELLGREGYQVRPTNDPQMALDSALAQPPKLILLDVKMPKMDGYEVCEYLKQDKRTRDIPILFISALHELQDKIIGFKAGGVDFITKPFQELEVLARVRTHMDLRNMQLKLEEIVTERTVELVESEAKYRGLFDNALVGVFNSTLNGEFLFVNGALARMYDFDSPEQMLAEGSLPRWIESKQREQLIFKLQEYGSVSNFEAETITCIGRNIHILFSVKLQGEVIAGMVMDITERKLAEIELGKTYREIEQLQKQLKAESAYLQDEIKLEHNFKNIIGQSKALKYSLHRVEQVAPQDSTVLIFGETGTGKELIARALHELSLRKDRPLVKVNCAALPSELIESELFGREKGAYTGAVTTQIGRFELANGSSLFLDEIGEMPLALQAKLLRVIESGEYERLGNSRTMKSDARIIAVTNRNLEEEVRKNRFREDLLYRLKIFPITVPPLRDRADDIPLLVNSFVQFFSRKMGKSRLFEISQSSMKALSSYSWPGNIRELKHVIEGALIAAQGNTLHFDLPQNTNIATGCFKTFEEMERDYILKVIEAHDWRVAGQNSASSILNMPASTLRSRMNKLGIRRP